MGRFLFTSHLSLTSSSCFEQTGSHVCRKLLSQHRTFTILQQNQAVKKCNNLTCDTRFQTTCLRHHVGYYLTQVDYGQTFVSKGSFPFKLRLWDNISMVGEDLNDFLAISLIFFSVGQSQTMAITTRWNVGNYWVIRKWSIKTTSRNGPLAIITAGLARTVSPQTVGERRSK